MLRYISETSLKYHVLSIVTACTEGEKSLATENSRFIFISPYLERISEACALYDP